MRRLLIATGVPERSRRLRRLAGHLAVLPGLDPLRFITSDKSAEAGHRSVDLDTGPGLLSHADDLVLPYNTRPRFQDALRGMMANAPMQFFPQPVSPRAPVPVIKPPTGVSKTWGNLLACLGLISLADA